MVVVVAVSAANGEAEYDGGSGDHGEEDDLGVCVVDVLDLGIEVDVEADLDVGVKSGSQGAVGVLLQLRVVAPFEITIGR